MKRRAYRELEKRLDMANADAEESAKRIKLMGGALVRNSGGAVTNYIKERIISSDLLPMRLLGMLVGQTSRFACKSSGRGSGVLFAVKQIFSILKPILLTTALGFIRRKFAVKKSQKRQSRRRR